MSERPLQDSAWMMYGVMAGGARLLLPPTVDLAVVRSVRGAMFDRMARAHEVTLTAGARKILSDLEQPNTIRGTVEQGARWVVDQLVPGARTADAAYNLLRTYTAGALVHRYFLHHRLHPGDPVLAEIEAERLRAALRSALNVAEGTQGKVFAEQALQPVREAEHERGGGFLQRWSDAFAAMIAELPAAWLDAAEQTFLEVLKKYR